MRDNDKRPTYQARSGPDLVEEELEVSALMQLLEDYWAQGRTDELAIWLDTDEEGSPRLVAAMGPGQRGNPQVIWLFPPPLASEDSPHAE